jgi:hypothetical protein
LLSVATAVALLILYLLIHWVLTHHVRTLSSCLGVLVAAGPAALIFFLGLPGGPIFGLGEGAVAVLLYIGASLIVMAARGDPGCEVMTLPIAPFEGLANWHVPSCNLLDFDPWRPLT